MIANVIPNTQIKISNINSLFVGLVFDDAKSDNFRFTLEIRDIDVVVFGRNISMLRSSETDKSSDIELVDTVYIFANKHQTNVICECQSVRV